MSRSFITWIDSSDYLEKLLNKSWNISDGNVNDFWYKNKDYDTIMKHKIDILKHAKYNLENNCYNQYMVPSPAQAFVTIKSYLKLYLPIFSILDEHPTEFNQCVVWKLVEWLIDGQAMNHIDQNDVAQFEQNMFDLSRLLNSKLKRERNEAIRYQRARFKH